MKNSNPIRHYLNTYEEKESDLKDWVKPQYYLISSPVSEQIFPDELRTLSPLFNSNTSSFLHEMCEVSRIKYSTHELIAMSIMSAKIGAVNVILAEYYDQLAYDIVMNPWRMSSFLVNFAPRFIKPNILQNLECIRDEEYEYDLREIYGVDNHTSIQEMCVESYYVDDNTIFGPHLTEYN